MEKDYGQINFNTHGIARMFALLFFASITFWNSFTLFYGVTSVLGSNNMMTIFVSITFTLIITLFLVGTFKILRNKDRSFVKYLSILMWSLSVIYDLFTAFIGNSLFIMKSGEKAMISQIIVLVGITIFTSTAPIILSSLFYNNDSND